MGNDNQFIEQPLPAFVNPTTATTTKDGIVAIQTPIEPIDSRQTLLNEQKFSTKTIHRSTSSFLKSTDKLFAITLFILLIILISYILFHGRIIDVKLSRLINKSDLKSDDIRSLFEEMNRTLKSIERLLIEQTKKTNINLQLNGQDIREFYSNQTVLNEFLRRLRERL
jgi:predicted PurR-regulated permease PerM